jgi:hypothetical protein
MAMYSLEVSQERAALMREQRRKIVLQMARLRAELVPKEMIGVVWSRLVGNFRARALGIGSKVAGGLRGEPDPAVIRDRIDSAITEALAELSSEGNFERFVGELEVVGVPRIDPGSDEDGDAAAAADGERVGRRKPKAKSRGVGRAGAVAHQASRVSAGNHGRRQRSSGPGGGSDELGADREDGDPE